MVNHIFGNSICPHVDYRTEVSITSVPSVASDTLSDMHFSNRFKKFVGGISIFPNKPPPVCSEFFSILVNDYVSILVNHCFRLREQI
ncbi:hypothetical protein DU504_10760 [Haloplanus salinus]|uniref:Uncharacterized protein n=1 Tax=Haloplanus salinus TaxID=1126245 RepID=A0A368NAY2_9EURY|nr:hypothetical protein DU504_10760 [Haloplanus salinus]